MLNGCIKYADLGHNRNHEYICSFDMMLEDKGNTAVYILCAYIRIRSIPRTAKVTDEQLEEVKKNDKDWLPSTRPDKQELPLSSWVNNQPRVRAEATKILSHMCGLCLLIPYSGHPAPK